MQLSSIPKLMLKRLCFVARSPWRVYRAARCAHRLRTVERALHKAWPETKERIAAPRGEVPPSQSAYWCARRELDVWAWVHGVPFVPFSPYRTIIVEDQSDDDGEGVLSFA